MSTPLLRYPDRCVNLSPVLFGPAAYYAALAAYGTAYVGYDARWDKRYKALHRYEIADTRGRLMLTVPVTVPHGLDHPLRRSDVKVSRHGEWWKLHRTALESAYGRTPYFEFVIDRFHPLLSDPGEPSSAIPVSEFARLADRAVLDFLGIDTQIADHPQPQADEMRGVDFPQIMLPQYRQIREASLGFFGGLSVLDLIFNLGPEAPLYLRDVQPLVLAQRSM